MARGLVVAISTLLICCPAGQSEQDGASALPQGPGPDPVCAATPEGMRCVSADQPALMDREPADCPEPTVQELGSMAEAALPTFFIDATEVTVGQVERCVARCGCSDHLLRLVSDADPGAVAQGLGPLDAEHFCRAQGKHLPSPAEWRASASLRDTVPTGLPGAGAQLNAISLLSGFRCAASPEEAAVQALWRQQGSVFVPLDAPTVLREIVDGESWRSLEAEGPLPEKAHALRDEVYRTHVGRPPVVAEGRVQANASFKDVWMVEDALFAWHQLYPEITRVGVIGLSHQGRPILAMRISDHPDRDEDEPAVLINGSAHGHELLTTDYAFHAIEQVLTGWSQGGPERRWVEQLDLWVVPLVNPDGNWTTLRIVSHPRAEIGRKNGRDNDRDCSWEPPQEGVDLNRNYPFAWGMLGEEGSKSQPGSTYYRGPSAGSEPEPQALMRLADRYRFAAAVSFHTWGTMIMSPYTVPGLVNPEPDTAWVVAQEIVDGMPVQPNGRRFTVKKMMYPVDGTDQDWLYHEHGTLAYILEGSHHNPLELATRQASTEGAWPFTRGLIERLLAGPGIAGHVRDPQGLPLEATVQIPEILLQQEEDWRSRPHDGRFDRYLPSAGEWTVEAYAEGYRPGRASVYVDGHAWTVVDLVLEPR